MGRYLARRPGYMEGWKINAAEFMFQGLTDEEIGTKLWGDKISASTKKRRLKQLREEEKFQEYYKTLVSEWSIHHVGRALSRIAHQIDDVNGWLANKAANDVLTQSKLFMTGADDNQIVVKVEGMPELGSPED